jgi:parvulin-like peptidyl-prolyl isomerase
MTKPLFTIVIILLCIVFDVGAESLPRPAKIIASVENEPITLRDLEEFERTLGIVNPPPEGSAEFKKLYEEFLTQVLVEREAKAQGLSVSQEDIDAYIEEIKNQNKIDDGQLNELLKSKNLNLQYYRKQIAQEILRTRLIQQYARQRISISEEEVHRYLGVDTGEKGATEVHLLQIFVPLAEDGRGSSYSLYDAPLSESTETAKERRKQVANEIREKISAVEDFRSAGGSYFSDLGMVDPQELREELREVVSELDEGDVSDVVESDSGFYIFALSRVKKGSLGHLSEQAKEEARRAIFEGRLKEEMESFISRDLPKKHSLERKL